MVEIIVNKVLDSYYTNDDGDKLSIIIRSHLSNKEKVTINFQGISSVNSSFVNSAFIELLSDYSFSFIKKNISFTNTTKQINNLILERFKFESKRESLIYA
ncbi:MAG: DUF4325 domain-containing protein [Vagococcus sp.]|uniref:STAS-like domain-containing protein n=1 Tax=Vagococcus sp. TaxID=1933889 RepID=UPI002FC775F5